MNFEEKLKSKYYLYYFGIAVIVLIGVFSPFLIFGKTLIGEGDSLHQYIPFLIKIREFYINNINALFHGKEIMQIDYRTFVGLDVIQAYNYYGYGNIFCIICVFFKPENMHIAYALFYFIQVLLGGALFSAYCLNHKKEHKYVLLASIVYITSPMSILIFADLPFFGIVWQVPLIFIAVDKLIDENKGWLFSITVMLIALSGIYFLYKITIFAFIYGILKIFRKNKGVKNIINDLYKKIFKSAFHYFIGIGLSAPIFLPNLFGFFCASRKYQEKKFGFMFYWSFRLKENVLSLIFYFPEFFITFNIATIIIIVYVLKGKSSKLIKWLTIAFILIAPSSVVGFIMNGFTSPRYRWFMFFSFFISYVSIYVMKERKEKFRSFFSLIVITTVIQPFIMSYLYAQNEYCVTGKEIESYVVGTKKIPDNVTERVEFVNDIDDINKRIYSYNDYSSMWFYMSTFHELGYNMMSKYDNAGLIDLNTMYGINVRPELGQLFNVKYLFDYKNEDIKHLYGYKKLSRGLYENENYIPFGYCYDSLINEEKVDKLNPIDKAYLSLEKGIVEGKYNNDELVKNDVGNEELYYKKEKIKLKQIDGGYKVLFDEIKQKQIYVSIKDEKREGIKIWTDLGGKDWKFITIPSGEQIYSLPNRKSVLYNLQYHDSISELDFKTDKELKEDDIVLYSVDAKSYIEKSKKIGETHLENVKFETNKIKGTVKSDGPKMMCLSIPNIKGYKVYLDGKEVESYVVNYMFMGIEIPKGEHRIEVVYKTPLLDIGIWILVSVMVCVAFYYIFVWINKSKKVKHEK